MKVIECPRDAMQGMHHFIPTQQKIEYISGLLDAGFHTLDCGSFVSPKAIPQLSDTHAVLEALDISKTTTRLLVIVANERGASDAVSEEKVSYVGFPFSVSEEFQKRNTNSTREQSMSTVERITNLCEKQGKIPVVYLSMAFGNPYGELWHPDLVCEWADRLLARFNLPILSLADTIGSSTPETIVQLFTTVLSEHPSVEWGAHLHTSPNNWRPKVEAAWQAGCCRFDGALGGFGGCPMADDELVGNMPTERLCEFLREQDQWRGASAEVLNRLAIQFGKISKG